MRYAARSDQGRIRTKNEDSWNIILNRDSRAVGFVVADGMGGHKAGDVASRIAVEVMSETIISLSALQTNLDDAEVFLRDGMDEANRRIMTYAAEHLRGIPSGTTLTAAYIDGPMLLLIHIGDSRAYLLRDGRMRQLSHDHTYVAELVATGVIQPEDAKIHPERNKITRALGFDDCMKPEVYLERLRANDRFLFCTDGLTEYVNEAEMLETLVAFPPHQAVDTFIEMANNRGGKDNITAIVAVVDGGDAP